MESTNSEIQLTNQPENNNESGYQKPNLSSKLIIVLVVLIIIFIASSIFIIILNRNSSEDLSRENERLVQINPELSDSDLDELAIKRDRVYKYAEEKGITVSNAEVEAEKSELVELNGEESVNADLQSKGWSQEDWTEVVKWQILRSKILSSLEAYRIGELFMIRWDGTIQGINESIASERRPAVEEYLSSVREDLLSDRISNLKEAQSVLVIEENPFFSDFPYEYQVQYSGIGSFGALESDDPQIDGYYRFEISDNVANAERLSTLSIPSISEVSCDIRSCYIYNIVGGSDGAGNPEEEEILQILQSELPI